MSPGWSREEAETLKLLLMRHGVGRWVRISDSGLLPGKQIQQLSAQTQRLLGQQSLAAFTGLQVDVDRIRADNEARVDAPRKAGLIVNSGPNPTREIVKLLRAEAEKRYGLSREALALVDARLDEIARERFLGGPLGRRALEHPILALDAAALTDAQLRRFVAILKQQEARLEATAAALRPGGGVYAPGGGGSGANGSGGAAAADANTACALSAARSASASLDPARGPGAADARGGAAARPGSAAGAPRAGASRAGSGSPGPGGTATSGAARPGKKGKGSRGGGASKKRAAPEADGDEEGAGGRRDSVDPEAALGSDDEEWKPRAASRAAKGRGRRAAGGGGAGGRAARRRGGGEDELEVALASLEAMGFSRKMARDAMRECDDDVAAALDWLLAMAG